MAFIDKLEAETLLEKLLKDTPTHLREYISLDENNFLSTRIPQTIDDSDKIALEKELTRLSETFHQVIPWPDESDFYPSYSVATDLENQRFLNEGFSVNPRRATKYIDSRNINYSYSGSRHIQIPLGPNDNFIEYQGTPIGGEAQRDREKYLAILSGLGQSDSIDDFENETFFDGGVVVDLGSGEAIGLMELSLRHPRTSIIGIDQLYTQKRKVDSKLAGLQLTNGDWNNLDMLESNSVDSLISVAGKSQWGIKMKPMNSEIDESAEDEFEEAIDNDSWKKDLAEYHRVLKVGGKLIFGQSQVKMSDLIKNVDLSMWEVLSDPNENRLELKKK